MTTDARTELKDYIVDHVLQTNKFTEGGAIPHNG